MTCTQIWVQARFIFPDRLRISPPFASSFTLNTIHPLFLLIQSASKKPLICSLLLLIRNLTFL
ncbi:hypothetical protein BJP43_07045 [Candidatus Williamhamiltonella defendens]|uniref:Uncharacterized protein n=1 Tax=Candidatus Williamhamiltonella defendens TaxID=138072 RepID=A0A2D3TE97_9ENTR|nr:hypothetical protein BJP43_07045 [Candidatus Hamiltonella defensa]